MPEHISQRSMWQKNDNYLAASGLTDSRLTFTLEPRKLLVSVADVVIDRGDAMPELTVRVGGFADGEVRTVLQDSKNQLPK